MDHGRDNLQIMTIEDNMLLINMVVVIEEVITQIKSGIRLKIFFPRLRFSRYLISSRKWLIFNGWYFSELPEQARYHARPQGDGSSPSSEPSCGVSEWGEWSECSSICDSGLRLDLLLLSMDKKILDTFYTFLCGC